MVIGGLALSGIPPFSGFFSKDEILTYVAAREDWHVVLAVAGYIGAFLTAVYTWRMIFRAFLGDEVEPARVLRETRHLYHAPTHTNPATGEEEDTDVGFPGPDHHAAEKEWSMKGAMGLLAILATVGGVLQIPNVTHILESFLEPTFAESRYFEELHPSDTLTYGGLIVGALAGALGIALAYRLWVQRPERPAALRERLAGVHGFFVRKWYFDELIEGLIVRPFAWFGRFGRNVFERVVVNGLFVGGTAGAVRAGSAAVRAAQTGFLRYYAALLLFGVTALALYFLIAAS
jgi:NADH-quinone oxidoreductase subunit L